MRARAQTLAITLTAAVVAVVVMAGPVPVVEAAPPSATAAQAGCHRTRPAYPEIKPGTTSGAVRTLQCVLNDTRFGPVTVDGFYGPETQAAIDEFTGNFECCIAKPLLVRTWYWTILFSQSHKLQRSEARRLRDPGQDAPACPARRRGDAGHRRRLRD